MKEDSNIDFDHEGMAVYQHIVDHCDTCLDQMSELISKLKEVDQSGQFLASTARYLAAIDREKFNPWIAPIIEAAIDKDRERKYIGSLLQAIWGEDYEDRVDALAAEDNNFRRIYKRIHTEDNVM